MDLTEMEAQYLGLSPELRYTVRANLATLSLLDPRPALPDSRAHRNRLAAHRRRLEREGENGP